MARHLSGHDARPQPDGEHPGRRPPWAQQERQVRQHLLFIVDSRAALPDAHAVHEHDHLARVGGALDHLHGGDQALLVEADGIGRALFDADKRPRMPGDEQARPEQRGGERGRRAQPDKLLPARRKESPCRRHNRSGARQHDAALHARKREQHESRQYRPRDVAECERPVELPEVATRRADAAHAQGTRERKDHADQDRGNQHDEKCNPESGEAERDPTRLQSEHPLLRLDHQRVHEWDGRECRRRDAGLHPTKGAAWLPDASDHASHDRAPQRDPDEESREHGHKSVCGAAHDQDQQSSPDHFQRQRHHSRQGHGHEQTCILAMT